MRGHFGAVLTSGLAAVALALALLQAIVVAHGAHRLPEVTAAHSGASNRYSVPGGRSGIPFMPFDKARPPDQGQKPQRQQHEHHSPPPSRMRAVPPHVGPQQPRKMAA
ncbi:MAG: hypothetical protein ABR567_13595 [Myxococcales bacterium]|nr:hypothetical protein [Myxococcales bacterium]